MKNENLYQIEKIGILEPKAKLLQKDKESLIDCIKCTFLCPCSVTEIYFSQLLSVYISFFFSSAVLANDTGSGKLLLHVFFSCALNSVKYILSSK